MAGIAAIGIENVTKPSAADIGLARKQVHAARA
jgi:hypothetical protein